MTIANYITFSRIFISPIFLYIYLYREDLGLNYVSLSIILFSLLALSELSDAIDGYLARKYNEVTDLGKILDPMADSIYRISIFLTFTLPPVKIPLGIVFLILYRDSVVSTLRTICAMKGFTLAARKSGKIKAVIQAIAAFFILIFILLFGLNIISQDELTWYSTIAVFIAAIYTLYSGIDYIFANRKYIRHVLKPIKNH